MAKSITHKRPESTSSIFSEWHMAVSFMYGYFFVYKLRWMNGSISLWDPDRYLPKSDAGMMGYNGVLDAELFV